MADSDAILTQLRSIVGDSWIYERNSDSAAPYTARYGAQPLAVALPGTIEELQAVVVGATNHAYTLWVMPNSAGNGAMMGNGEQATVLIDLKRLNSIIEVNTSAAYALVEPGVSYQQLHTYLQENNTGLWVDCDRNGMNSIAGSICDRDLGYTPYGDHIMMQCGMEVMLADGGLVRTGMGALPNANTWQLFKYGFGPYVDGLFTQSNLGIVTKIGLWLMSAPPAYQPFMVSVSDAGALAAMVDIMQPLKVNMIIGNTAVVSHALLDVAPYENRTAFVSDGKVDLARVQQQHELGVWNLYGALYGIPENVELLWSMIEPAFQSIAGARIYQQADRGDDPVWRNREKMMRGVPDQGFAGVENWNGNTEIVLSATAAIDGEDAQQLHDLVAKSVAQHGFDYLCEYALGWRALTKRIHLPFDRDDTDSAARAEACARELATVLPAAGFGLTLASAGYLPLAMSAYDQGGLGELRGRLKTALDPHGVFAPL